MRYSEALYELRVIRPNRAAGARIADFYPGIDARVLAAAVTSCGKALHLFDAHDYLCAGMPLLDVGDCIGGATQLITPIDHRRDSSGFHQLA